MLGLNLSHTLINFSTFRCFATFKKNIPIKRTTHIMIQRTFFFFKENSQFTSPERPQASVQNWVIRLKSIYFKNIYKTRTEDFDI